MKSNKTKKTTEKSEDLILQDFFIKFHQRFVSCLRKEAENLQLTISQLEILRFIVGKQDQTMKDIASHLKITAPSATSIIDNLYDKKLIRRKIDPRDRRGVLIYPTKKTLNLFLLFKNIKTGVLYEILSPLTSEDKKQLTAILKKLI